MKWTIKARIQKMLSSLPLGRQVYGIGQRYVGRLKEFRIESRLPNAFQLIECLAEEREDLLGKRLVEIGTGWAPVLPLFFWLYGHKRCDTFDITRWLQDSLVEETARQLATQCRQPASMLAQWQSRCKDLEVQRLPILEG